MPYGRGTPTAYTHSCTMRSSQHAVASLCLRFLRLPHVILVHTSRLGLGLGLGGWDGMGARRRRGGGFQKWASVPGPLYCARTVVATKGAGTQIMARKTFFHPKIFAHICVVKTISVMWGSF